MHAIHENADLLQCRQAGRGYIYNDYSGSNPTGHDYNILHAAECSMLARSNVRVPKVFFTDQQEALTWLNANRGPEGANWRRCRICGA
jgi:hypothetical protein